MKLSTRGRYGVRLMFDLALNFGKGPIPLKDIAKRQDISEHYLEQLVAPLRRAGMVTSIRGAQGGYELSKRPEEITVGDIIRVLEGPIAPVECAGENTPYESSCKRADKCVARLIWERLRDSITSLLDSITLADMCEDAGKLSEKRDNYMYYI
ncbi:MAG TPA: Rrf2 family transcriptional regulator [Firmicutes bacterium]|nr:Rrf2 family transcriptional regulator [Bacillota bacterium]